MPSEPHARVGTGVLRRLQRGILGCEIGGALAIADATGDECLYSLQVLSIEGLEDLRVGGDPAQLLGTDAALAHADEGQATTERAWSSGQGQLSLHTSYWSQNGNALQATPATAASQVLAAREAM
jgi:hypothetical protein